MSSTQVLDQCERCGSLNRVHGWLYCRPCLDKDEAPATLRVPDASALEEDRWRRDVMRGWSGRPHCQQCDIHNRTPGYLVCGSCLNSAVSGASMKVESQGSTEATARAQREAPSKMRASLRDPHYVWPKRTARDVVEDAVDSLAGLGYVLLALLGAGIVALIIWGIAAVATSFENDVDQVRCVTVGDVTQCVNPGEPGYDALAD
jgi:hypothetical protein